MENLGYFVFLDQRPSQLQVLDITDHQFYPVQTFDLLGIGGIGELVQHDNAVIGMVAMPVMHQVAADEPGATGDEDGFRHLRSPGKRRGMETTDEQDRKSTRLN